MAGQAGWYRAPGEEGLLRYWNGGTWTDHRQPDPAAPRPQEPALPAQVAPEPDPMAEYERQFETPSPRAAGSDAPQYRPRSGHAASVFAPSSEFAGQATTSPLSFSLGVIGLGPAAPAPTPPAAAADTQFDRAFDEFAVIAQSRALPPVEAETPLGEIGMTAAEHPVPDAVDSSRRRGALAAAWIMGAGMLIILLGVAAMALFSLQTSLGTGEARTNAIVTSLGATSGNSCTPIARFAVAGRSYTASSSAPITPCPIGLGESVDVVYSATDPAAAARIEVGGSVTQYLWLAPILGGLVFLGGMIAFIVRAGSILAGIALLREGRGRTARQVSAP